MSISRANIQLSKAEIRLENTLGSSDEILKYFSDILKSGELAKEIQQKIYSFYFNNAKKSFAKNAIYYTQHIINYISAKEL